jgi:alpha-L-rhamnosidase
MTFGLSIDRLSIEHYAPTSPNHVLGISHTSPRISWRFAGDVESWTQRSYTITIQRSGIFETFTRVSDESVLVPWPTAPLKPREIAEVTVEVEGNDGWRCTSPKLKLEVALANDGSDWHAQVITCPKSIQTPDRKRPFLLRKRFTLSGSCDLSTARLYATAYGLYEVSINGSPVGDHVLAPGWQSYRHRLHYQTYDVGGLVRPGENELLAWVAPGWYAGSLSWMRTRVYGEHFGLLAQLEMDNQTVLTTNTSDGWQWSLGEIVAAEIYDGESWDWSDDGGGRDWNDNVESLGRPTAKLIAAEAPPVRRIQQVAVQDTIMTPKGNMVLDFGQNLVGRLRIHGLPAEGTITLTHAEVLENGELGVRPLRTAKCQDTIKLGPRADTIWEPKFTFHGFRYVQVDGWLGFTPADRAKITAAVIHSDMERTGWFECSHESINQLHRNVVWSMRGNFLSVPTDCPQRDERYVGVCSHSRRNVR